MTLCDNLLWTGLCLLHKHLLRDVLRNRCLSNIKLLKILAKSLKYTSKEIFMPTTCNLTKKTGRLMNKKSIKLSKFVIVPNIISKFVGGCFLYWIKIADNMNEKNSSYMNKNNSNKTTDFNQWLGWNFKENISYRANSLNTFLKQ